MNVLFFIEPKIERNEPFFRYPTIRNSLLPQAAALRQQGHSTLTVIGKHLVPRLIEDRLDSSLGPFAAIDDRALSQIEPSYKALAHKGLTNEFTHTEKEILAKLVKAAVGSFEPDLIVVWESAAEYLRDVFPGVPVVFELPGPFSRAPFPSYTMIVPKMMARVPFDDTSVSLNDVRRALRTSAFVPNSVKARLDQIRLEFSKIILYALQVDDYFMVDEIMAPYGSQFGALEYLLREVPDDIGILVTLYKSRNIQTGTFNEQNLKYLTETYPNFIFDDGLNKHENVSQLVLPALDGVVVASSSVGFQAALWEKPLFTLGESHISELSTSNNFEEFIEQVRSGAMTSRDGKLGFLLQRHAFPTNLPKADPNAYCSFVQSLAQERGFCRDVDPAREIIENLRTPPQIKGALKGRSSRIDDVIRSIVEKRPVTSFDIFDTLLVRPFATPRDLFKLMQPEVSALIGRRSVDFETVRRAAEQEAFKLALAEGRKEITIDEIYAVLAERLSIEADVAQRIQDVELEIEAGLLYPRRRMAEIYHGAVAAGKDVYLISDMYLHQHQLEKILLSNGFKGHRQLFLSSANNAKKQSGELFKIFKAATSESGDRIVHIGDNEIGDLKRAAEHGLKPIHILKPWDIFVKSFLYRKVWKRDEARHSLSLRCMLAVIANECFEDHDEAARDRLFPRGRRDLGFIGFGPFILSFAHWLIERATKDGIDTLYFLSRDGKILKEAYDLVARFKEGAPKSRYLYCSRRCANVAKLKTFEDICDLLAVDIAAMTVERLIEVRFGLTPAIIQAQTRHFPVYESLRSRRINNTNKDEALPVLEELKSLILENAAAERDAYTAYLDSAKFFDSNSKAVVDVGYAGTMQESLHELTDYQQQLSGYYIVTFRPALERCEAKGLKTQGYLGNFIDRHDTHLPFCRHVPLYESLLSSDQQSLKCFRRGLHGAPIPIFQEPTRGENERRTFARQIHSGAMEFVRCYTDVFGKRQFMFDFEPAKSFRVLQSYFDDPTFHDAHLMADLIFEDNYAGGTEKKILHAGAVKLNDSVWKQGIAALQKKDKERVYDSRRKFFMPFVRPFIRTLGNATDMEKFDSDPAAFFASLKSDKYRYARLVGQFLFGASIPQAKRT